MVIFNWEQEGEGDREMWPESQTYSESIKATSDCKRALKLVQLQAWHAVAFME